jgi:amino acid permease
MSLCYLLSVFTREEKLEKKEWVLMSSGGIGYALYIGSLWCLAEGGPDGFVIASGAILGTTAALLCKSRLAPGGIQMGR